MELITLASLGAKYIIDSIKNSKTLDNAKENALGKFVSWIKVKLFKSNPNLEQAINEPVVNDQKETVIREELMKMLQDKEFLNEFKSQLSGISNIFEGEIEEVTGSVQIGNNIDTAGTEGHFPTGGVNEFKKEGRIGKIGGNFQIGDNIK